MTYVHLAKHFRLALNNLKILYWINDLSYLAGELSIKYVSLMWSIRLIGVRLESKGYSFVCS